MLTSTTRFFVALCGAVSVLLLSVGMGSPAQAQQVPEVITYQGTLTDPDGNAVNSEVDLVFRFYDGPEDGAAQLPDGDWEERYTGVSVQNGRFSVQLGSQTENGLPDALFDNRNQLWLEIAVDGEALPRTRMTSTAFAREAQSVVDGAAVQSLNGLTDAVTLSEGENISITQDGNELSIAATMPDGGLTSITTNETLSGVGTEDAPLGLAEGAALRSLAALDNSGDEVTTLVDAATLRAGDNVEFVEQSGGLTISAAGPEGGISSVSSNQTLDGNGTASDPLRLAPDAVTSANIFDGEVKSDDIGAGAVTEAKILDDAVSAAKINDAAAVKSLNTITGAVSLISSDESLNLSSSATDSEVDVAVNPSAVVAQLNELTGPVSLVGGENVSIESNDADELTISTTDTGLLEVASDATLTGTGTDDDELGIAENGVGRTELAGGVVVDELNGLTGGVTIQTSGGAQISRDTDTNTITIDAGAGSGSSDIQSISSPDGTIDVVNNDGSVSIDVADGGVGSAQLASDAVTGDVIQDGSIQGADLADEAVGTDQLADGAVTANQLAGGSVSNAALQNNAVTSAQIDDGTITAADLGTGSVGSTEIQDGAVTRDDLSGDAAVLGLTPPSNNTLRGEVSLAAGENITITDSGNEITIDAAATGLSEVATSDQFNGDGTSGNPLSLAIDAVTQSELADNAVGSDELQDNTAVTGLSIQNNGSNTIGPLQNGVTLNGGNNIALGRDGSIITIDAGATGLQSVSTDGTLTGDGTSGNPLGIANGGVDTDQLANGVVTEPKLQVSNSASNGQVLSFSDADGLTWTSVGEGDITAVNSGTGLTGGGTSGDVTLSIANGGVNTAQLASGAVDSDAIANGSVAPVDLDGSGGSSGQVLTTDGDNVSWDSPTASVLTDGETIVGDGTSGNALSVGTIGSGQIDEGAITDVELADDAVDTDAIQSGAVNSDAIANGAVNAADLAANAALQTIEVTNDGNSVTGTGTVTFEGTNGIAISADNDANAVTFDGSSLGGLNSVNTDGTLTGDGTSDNELGIAENGVSATEIAENAVGASELANDAVDSGAIQGEAVTEAALDVTNEPENEGQVLTYGGDNNFTWEEEITTSGVSTLEGLDGDLSFGGSAIPVVSASDETIELGIGPDAVGSNELADGAVDAAAIQSDAVGSGAIAANAVTGSELADDVAVRSLNGQTEAIDLTSDDGSVTIDASTTGEIDLSASGATTVETDGTTISGDGTSGSELMVNEIGSGEIANGSITADDLSAGSVGSDELQTNAVDADAIADGAVGTTELASEAVTTAEISPSGAASGEALIFDGTAVTWGTVAADVEADGTTISGTGTSDDPFTVNTIGSGEIADGSIESVDINDGTITASDLGAGSVGTSELQSNAVDSDAIADGAVAPIDLDGSGGSGGQALITDGTTVSWGNPDATVVADGNTITGDGTSGSELTVNEIGSSEIVDGSITDAELATDAVDEAAIQTGAVTTDGVLDGTLTTADFDSGVVNTAVLADGAVTTAKLSPTPPTDGDGDQVLTWSDASNELIWQTEGALSSSIRWKENVRTLERPLQLVEQLRGVRYDWTESGEADVGVIAEEVAEVLPELVEFDGDGQASGVHYAKLVSVLIEATKAQQKTLDDKEATIEAQREQIGRQQEEIDALNDRMDRLERLVEQVAGAESAPSETGASSTDDTRSQ